MHFNNQSWRQFTQLRYNLRNRPGIDKSTNLCSRKLWTLMTETF